MYLLPPYSICHCLKIFQFNLCGHILTEIATQSFCKGGTCLRIFFLPILNFSKTRQSVRNSFLFRVRIRKFMLQCILECKHKIFSIRIDSETLNLHSSFTFEQRTVVDTPFAVNRISVIVYRNSSVTFRHGIFGFFYRSLHFNLNRLTATVVIIQFRSLEKCRHFCLSVWWA